MTRKFFLFILLVFSTILFSAELTLRSENIFLCDVVEETPDFVLILYKEQKYKIPRTDILSLEKDVTGKHSSYKNSKLKLDDGKIASGQIVEESKDMITLKSGEELTAIPKERIVDYQRAENKEYSIPDSYKLEESKKESSSWTWGFYGLALHNGKITREINSASYGAGFFVEPAFGKIKDKLQVGFQTEYFTTGGVLSYSFFQNLLYLKYDFNLWGLNLYSKIGLGTSNIILSENGNSASVLRGAGNIESGWENAFKEKYLLRIGLRANGVFTNAGVLDTLGIQASLAYRF